MGGSLQCWTKVCPGLALEGVVAVCMKVANVSTEAVS